jgi:hypothetical protein
MSAIVFYASQGRSTIAENLRSVGFPDWLADLISTLPSWVFTWQVMLLLLGATFLVAFGPQLWALFRWSRDTSRPHDFEANMHPRDFAEYMRSKAKWSERFDDRLDFYQSLELELRDKLYRKDGLQAQGRLSGKWGDGRFRNVADIIPRDYWKDGKINWMRLSNADYSGDIDAYVPGGRGEPSFDDVMFDRRQVEAFWPPRSWWRQKLRPAKFPLLEKPQYGPPPWLKDAEAKRPQS